MSRPPLVRAIGRWDLTAAVVNGVIGSAIFGMPAAIAARTGAWSPLAYLAAALGVLAIVLCFAEVASRFRDPGGPYLYCREAFGPFVGFQAGWLTFWVRVASLAANLDVFVLYLAQLVPAAGLPVGRALTMTLVVALITAVNLRGVRQATWTVDAFTVAKLAPLLLLVVLGLTRIRPEVLASQHVAAPAWTEAILLLMFAYGGFEAPLIPAGEATEPRRDSGFALLMALAIIAGVYMLIQLVVVGVLPAAATTKAPVAAVAEVLLGPAGLLLASVGALVSIYGYATGAVLQSPRLLYSMSAAGELPSAFASVHPRYRTPHVSILTFSALALGLGLYGNFVWNATLSAVVRLVTYGLTCVALPIFRRRRPSDPPGFRVPAGGAVAAVGALFCLWLLETRTLQQAWLLVAIIAVGALLWAAATRRSRARG
jgi:amino acid transporter